MRKQSHESHLNQALVSTSRFNTCKQLTRETLHATARHRIPTTARRKKGTHRQGLNINKRRNQLVENVETFLSVKFPLPASDFHHCNGPLCVRCFGDVGFRYVHLQVSQRASRDCAAESFLSGRDKPRQFFDMRPSIRTASWSIVNQHSKRWSTDFSNVRRLQVRQRQDSCGVADFSWLVRNAAWTPLGAQSKLMGKQHS